MGQNVALYNSKLLFSRGSVDQLGLAKSLMAGSLGHEVSWDYPQVPTSDSPTWLGLLTARRSEGSQPLA